MKTELQEKLREELRIVDDWLGRMFRGKLNHQECEYMSIRASELLTVLAVEARLNDEVEHP